mgnify:CR=1 FL=1
MATAAGEEVKIIDPIHQFVIEKIIDLGPLSFTNSALWAVIAVVCFFQVPVREAALDPEDHEKPPFRQRMHTALEAWREPRTYLLGTVMLGMSFAEGGANDWIALGTEQGHGDPEENAEDGFHGKQGSWRRIRSIAA